MKYFKLSIGINHHKYGNDFKYSEISNEEYLNIKNEFFLNSNYRFGVSGDTEHNMIWDFDGTNDKGYIYAIATEDTFDSIKDTIFREVNQFIAKTISWKTKEINNLMLSINTLQQHPIYKN